MKKILKIATFILFTIVGLFVSNNSMGVNIIPIKYSNIKLIVTNELPKEITNSSTTNSLFMDLRKKNCWTN